MLTLMEFPYRYIQGPGALTSTIAAQTRMYGQKVLLACDATAETMLSDCIGVGETSDLSVQKDSFANACTHMEIQRLGSAAKGCNADCIVAFGGPKLLDAAKVTASELRLPIIVSPIPLASESTGSNRAVVYSPEGAAERYIQLEKCVDVVIVDLDLIIKSPARFLASAMGSTLAVWFEAESVRKNGTITGNGFLPSTTAYDLSWLCYETLLEYGAQARIDCESGQITETLARIVETNTLVSGICFSNSGAASSHAIYNGLTALEETHKAYQGEKLAFATLVSLYLNNPAPDMIKDVFSFCDSVSLPTTLGDLGIKGTSVDVLLRIAQGACSPTQGMPKINSGMDPETVMQAILQADHEGKKRRNVSDQK